MFPLQILVIMNLWCTIHEHQWSFNPTEKGVGRMNGWIIWIFNREGDSLLEQTSKGGGRFSISWCLQIQNRGSSGKDTCQTNCWLLYKTNWVELYGLSCTEGRARWFKWSHQCLKLMSILQGLLKLVLSMNMLTSKFACWKFCKFVYRLEQSSSNDDDDDDALHLLEQDSIHIWGIRNSVLLITMIFTMFEWLLNAWDLNVVGDLRFYFPWTICIPLHP